MKPSSVFLTAFLFSSLFSLAQNDSATSITDRRNFIKTWEATTPQSVANVLMQKPLKEVKQSTSYFDGLSRPQQMVVKQGSLATSANQGTDLVSPVVYDGFGREVNKYLPYASAFADGGYKEGALLLQQSFYSATTSPLAGQGENYFYSHTDYEPSPLNRVTTTMAAGNSWVGANRGVGVSYQVNAPGDSVRSWEVTDVPGDFGWYHSPAAYRPGSLYKTVTTDEAGKKVVEYKDRLGLVVLKKVQASEVITEGHTGWLCTYYIYDDQNRLRAVLQPKSVEAMNGSGSWSPDAVTLGELAFRYAYDQKGRMTGKKVPGAGAVFMVYDVRDRLVMTQDANMRKPGQEKWLVTIYDELNRPFKTGLWSNSEDFHYHQAHIGDSYNYPSLSQGLELLTETHYDDYDNLPAGLTGSLAGGYAASLTAVSGDADHAENIIASAKTKGMVTWTTTKVLNKNQYLSTVNIYDDKGRVIQIQTENYSGGIDILTTQYDFSGKVLATHLQHHKLNPTAQTLQLATRNSYDALGRIITIEKNLNNTGWKAIAAMEYDALGQLQNKRLAPYYNNGQGLETLSYDYNIRGWLLGMNRRYLGAKNGSGYDTHFFGFELGYDKVLTRANTSFATPQYSGNIAGTLWKSAGDGVRRKYDFTYDAANRFGKADFTQNTDAAADGLYTTQGANFSVHGFDADNNYLMNYDANGNILSMVQHGVGALAPDVVIDALHYTYNTNSNKLQEVHDDNNDKGSVLGDFKYDPATKTAIDYGYDPNGNLVTDLNKKINGATGPDLVSGGAITYNHLNLPANITVEGKGSIEYVYDASGNKLSKIVHETGKADKSTLYMAGLVYQDDQLQFLSHEEGRIRPLRDANSQVTGYAYDYFLKDQLGNVRMVLTDEQQQEAYRAASLEQATLDSEKIYYRIPVNGRVNKGNVPGYPQQEAYTSPNDYVQQLNGHAQRVGTSIVLRVMSGDKVNIRASSWYRQNSVSAGGPQSALGDIVASLVQGITGGAAGKMGAITASQQQVLSTGVAGFLVHQSNQPSAATKPKSYLNWLLLDEQLKPVITNDGRNSGFDQVGEDQELKAHQVTERAITTNGYLYIYLSNESDIDVFFDNLQVTHTRGPILEETHYYPFGLEMAGISSKAAGRLENKKKYNGIEFDEDLDIDSYEAFYRNLDPQTGRWWQIDPKVEEGQETMSPYTSMGNDPIRYSDPLGDIPDDGGPGDPPSTATRIWGGVKAVGGLAEMAVGAVGGAATSWTGVGAVLGGAAVVHGADVVSSGISQMFSGTETKTFTEQGISKGLQAAGASEQKANTVASYADGTVSIVLTAGSGSVFNSSKLITTEVKATTNTGSKSLVEQAKSLVSGNGGKNSVTLRTPTRQIRYDLAGKAHGLVETPHKQIYNKNTINGVVKSITRASKEAVPMTQQDLRLIKKYIEKLNKP